MPKSAHDLLNVYKSQGQRVLPSIEKQTILCIWLPIHFTCYISLYECRCINMKVNEALHDLNTCSGTLPGRVMLPSIV
jgi:hypothetical protein